MGKNVCHYTRLNALSNILHKKEVCLWATRYDYLNDPLEQAWAQEIVLKKIQEKKEFKNLTPEEIKMLLEKKPYVLSLCKEIDNRVMWRLYADDGMGIILVLKYKDLDKMAKKRTIENPQSQYEVFNDVFYANEKNVDKKIDESLNGVVHKEIEEEDESKWTRSCAFIKHEDFIYENETRYAIIRDLGTIKISENKFDNRPSLACTGDNEGVKYRMRGDEPIPYLEVCIQPNALEKIIVGYRVKNFDVVKEYIENLLSQYGETYKHVEIEPSNVLYKV